MQRKFLILGVVCVCAVSLTGCTSLQRKFVRKKKTIKEQPRHRPIKTYTRKPVSELYRRHFVFWQTWHTELIKVLGKSHKKDLRCMQEIVGNLKNMQEFLVEERAALLKPHIVKLASLHEKMLRRSFTEHQRVRVLNVLERELRAILRGFTYKKAEPFLKQEE